MLGAIGRGLRGYARWLHTGWPAGQVEPLPELREDGRTAVPGVYVVGDLTGIPLLKFSADSGARTVRAIDGDPAFRSERASKPQGVHDLVIVGAGVGGMAAALEASSLGLDFVVVEAKRRFQTVADFPRAKPIYTYPTDFEPAGGMRFRAEVKEELLDELQGQTDRIDVREGKVESLRRRQGTIVASLAGGEELRALRAIVAIGRSGNFRKLDVPGEESDKVYNRLHDPRDFASKRTLVVVEKLRALESDPAADLTLALGTEVSEIRPDEVVLRSEDQSEKTLRNDFVFAMTGREAPVSFLRRAGIKIAGQTRGLAWLWVIGFFLAVFLLYDWKNDGFLAGGKLFAPAGETSIPDDIGNRIASLGSWWQAQVADRSTVVGTLAVSMKGRSFYYTLLYTLAVGGFGIARIRRRRTPYVTLQTTTLFLIQLFPLFLLPELILPWLGYNGMLDAGAGGAIADTLFEKYIPEAQYLAGNWPEWGHPRAYWRAYGLILAWPLMVYNVFTQAPIVGWLVVSFAQTFVLIPLLVWRWGKGAYCGWICSCGGLAETMGDTLRQKMPHGPWFNRLNMVGQLLLAIAFVLLGLRVAGWIWPESWMNTSFALLLDGKNADGVTVNLLSWKWTVDVIVAGVLGVGLYVKYSGRVWCRFACPLAALMHIYARLGRFRILADKKKCISCNVCTSVCHQGIDVMNFANKGLPMADPQCVRCSACVQSCPTGVLSFGRVDRSGRTIAVDSLRAVRRSAGA